MVKVGRFGGFLNRNNQSAELKKSKDEANIQKLLQKSEELTLKRQFDKALKCCDKALQINPKSPDVHFEIGVSLSACFLFLV